MIFWWSSSGVPLDLNLDTLKREILTYLESREFAVFRSAPGTLDGSQMVLWDSENYPDYQSRLRDLRRYEGQTCSIELAFNHDSRLYVYEMQPDWYEEYLTVEDEIAASLAEEDLDEGDSLGGYFSKN